MGTAAERQTERNLAMQLTSPRSELSSELKSELTERRRVAAVVGTLAGMRRQSDTLAEVAHDARNMVTALALYCDLLSEPGVLSPDYLHYASELRLISSVSRRLVERLIALDLGESAREALDVGALGAVIDRFSANNPAELQFKRQPNGPIVNLRDELLANANLLDAIAGLGIDVTVVAEHGACAVRLSGEDLTRVLVNLVKNAAETMRGAGRIQIALSEISGDNGAASAVVISIEDNGPGLPAGSLEKIFDAGYTTHAQAAQDGWTGSHRGLGLAITRSILESACGTITAENRAEGGARFRIELPVTTR